MKRISTFAVSILIIILAALAVSCGGSSIALNETENNSDQQAQPVIEEQIGDEAGKLPFPSADGEGKQEIVLKAKGASWVSSPDHLSPWASHNGLVDPADPGCYLLKGRKPVFTHVPKGPDFAYAIYELPLGALESDLLSMKVVAQPDAAGEFYFGAIANFDAMTWDWFGPEGASPSWGVDMTTLGYDFTNGAGNLYVAVLVPAAMSLHITDLVLEYKDREKPGDEKSTVWNVWGQAFEDYATGTPHAGYQVSFEDLNSGVVYTTMTAANGNWGMNLPSGHYRFGVDSNEMLLDVSGPVDMIDYIYDVSGFGIKLDLAFPGEFTYVDDNAAYFGSVVPMPLITANNYL